jgi:ribosomal protein L16 Arg81 hydroxylase
MSKERRNNNAFKNIKYQKNNDVEAPMISQIKSNEKMLRETDVECSDFSNEPSNDSIELNNVDENQQHYDPE